ncbi:MAG: L,D-transpeptidase family protein [Pseudomonadota bacterium]
MTDFSLMASSDGSFHAGDFNTTCAIGRSGVIAAAEKREGDGASPLGKWRLKRVFYRADRIDRPETALPVIPLRDSDGWCDEAEHPLYNRPVTLPFRASHEKLWREDHAYDVIVELAHNDAPVIAGLGSAIFFHLAHDDGRPTEGCVAVTLADMLGVLRHASSETHLEIRR